MNYYEELGLKRTATTEEIRQAYRRFARLIHPDRQGSNELLDLAEIQMARLNQLVEVLTDQVQRQEYDRSLDGVSTLLRMGTQPSLARTERIRILFGGARREVWVWLAAALLLLIGIGAFLRYADGNATQAEVGAWAQERNQEADVRPVAAPITEASHPTPRQAVPEKWTKPAPQSAPAIQEPNLTNAAVVAIPTPPAAAAGSGQELAAAAPAALSRVSPPTAIPQPSLAEAAPVGFAGHWLFLPAANLAPKAGMYAPEFIELKIEEKGGQVRGTYRARYLITDQAISPRVIFQFEGAAAAPVATLQWTGAGGSLGRVTLSLTSANSLEVNWKATLLSSELGLISGAAVLVRQPER